MVDGDNWLYASDYGVNEEGLTAMLAASDAHDIQTMVEGATLLKNDTGALPLTADETRVTLFGRASADPVYRGNSGGPRSTQVSLYRNLRRKQYRIRRRSRLYWVFFAGPGHRLGVGPL